jgi:predicted ArsR family transcriptional regulator
MTELSDAKRRILDRLKVVEHATAPELAELFGLTDTAVRQHLEVLEELELVERSPSEPKGRGRPPARWRLAPAANALFPDHHAELAVDLLSAIRTAHGQSGLDRVLDARFAGQLATYREVLPDPETASVRVRVRRLADIRSAEGYLAEAVSDGDAMVLVEHHCPICEAAGSCPGLCRAELDLFRAALGDDVTVERTQHLLSGDARCAYRVTKRS